MTTWRRVAGCICKATRAEAHAHASTHTTTGMCNNFCLSTATVVTGTRLSVMSYLYCVFFLLRRRM
jgi:hypothetical protein